MSYSRQMRRAAERRAQKEAQRERMRAAKQESSTQVLPAACLTPQASCAIPATARKQERAAACASEPEVETAADPGPDRDLTPKDEPIRIGPTGPRTPEGKAVSSLNNLKHGLTGAFRVLDERTDRLGAVVRGSIMESQSDFDSAHDALIAEHQPETVTECELVRRMAEHAWLSRRAQNLLDLALAEGDDKRFALYLRYQTTNDRGFRACLNDLLRLRREHRQAQKEFESQNRAAESHAARVRLANARAMHLEIDSDIKSYVEAPIPGYSSIPVEEVKDLFRSAMLSLQRNPAATAA